MKVYPYLCIFFTLTASTIRSQSSAVADSLSAELQSAVTPENRVDLLYELGASFLNTTMEHTDSILQVMETALTKVDYPLGELKRVTLRGKLAVNSGKHEEAIAFGKKGIQLAEELDSPFLKRENHYVLCTAYFRLFDSENALTNSYAALEISRQLEDQQGIAAAYYLIGNINWQILNYDEARKYYLIAKDILEELNDTDYLGNVYNNLTNVTDSVELQMEYARKALAIFEKTGHTRGIAFVNNSLGSIYHDDPENRDLNKALEHYLVAADIWEKMGYTYGILSIYGNIGSIYAEQGKTELALSYLDQALALARETGAEEEISDIFYYYFLAYGKDQDFERAKTAVDSFMVARERAFSNERLEVVTEMETKYKTEQTERELAEKQLQLEREKNKRKNILIGAIAALLFLTGLFQYYRNRQRIRRKETELALQLERTEAEKLRELDQLKSNFFANISHEFRTPLTLILSPLRQMIDGSFKADRQKYYRIMERNGRRLLRLVNQLLDLSRLEGGRMQLEVAKGDLSAFVRAIAFSFESLAIRKQVELVIDGADEPREAWFDPDKMEKILSNLLSNAFKFTPDGGAVSVHLESDENAQVILRVSDTGIGIPPEQLPRIFDRFYSVGQNEKDLTGTGIGLALTKELVELHHGRIEVESQAGQGAVFTVRFPIGEQQYTAKEKVPGTIPISKTTPAISTAVPDIKPILYKEEKPMILVVEDNADVRAFIRDQLTDQFQILEAEHGKEGWSQAAAQIPDLVITDLMMPEMDGVELCRKLKTDERTSHIPVIMLTAKAEREDRLEGLQTGADDYLIKPFDAEELRVRINNLIEQRRRLRERFGREAVFKPKEAAVTPVDETFLRQVLETIEANMDEETFSVVELSQAVSMSRSQLHRKLKALTDKSPNQIIREMRLQRAKELLEKGAGNASEIAFMVGFNSLAYFSKCFKDQFGVSPSEVG